MHVYYIRRLLDLFLTRSSIKVMKTFSTSTVAALFLLAMPNMSQSSMETDNDDVYIIVKNDGDHTVGTAIDGNLAKTIEPHKQRIIKIARQVHLCKQVPFIINVASMPSDDGVIAIPNMPSSAFSEPSNFSISMHY